MIRSNFAINLDEALHQDRSSLSSIQGILQSVSKEDDQGEAVAEFLSKRQCLIISARDSSTDMRPRRRLGSVRARKLVQQPVRRRTETLLVLLRTATHLDRKLWERWTANARSQRQKTNFGKLWDCAKILSTRPIWAQYSKDALLNGFGSFEVCSQ